jgi:hypothetical protein
LASDAKFSASNNIFGFLSRTNAFSPYISGAKKGITQPEN